MQAQLDWNEIQVDQQWEFEKPAIEKVQLVKYAGASGDFNPIHTDDETARKVGLPGVIAHGMINMGFLGQFAEQIAGNKGFVRRLQVRFLGMVYPGDVITCKAKVVEKDEENKTIHLELAAEKGEGKPPVVGSASIKFY